MKSMGRLLLLALPVLAVCTFLLVRTQLGGIAPASPVTSTDDEEPAFMTPRTAQLQPTVLAPEPKTNENSLPPGIEPEDIGPAVVIQDAGADQDEVIPIPDLQQPTTLLEFPSSSTE